MRCGLVLAVPAQPVVPQASSALVAPALPVAALSAASTGVAEVVAPSGTANLIAQLRELKPLQPSASIPVAQLDVPKPVAQLHRKSFPLRREPDAPPLVPAAPISPFRRYLYVLLLLALIPLASSTLHWSDADVSMHDRLIASFEGHPDAAQKFDELPDTATRADVFALIPDHRIKGALLPGDTWMHWAFALLSGAGFIAAMLVMFPTKQTKWTHLVGIGAITGTVGIVLLLAFQWIAFHMPMFSGGGWLTLILDLIWLIGQSYKMALGDYKFLPSFFGFTAGVGFCEEVCKALPLILMARGTGFNNWRTAMLWGLVSGVGFGVSEGITYSSDYYNGIEGAEIYFVRFVSCVALHAMWAAAIGITIFRRQVSFRGELNGFEWMAAVLTAVFVPMVLHGLYDTLLKKDFEVWALVVAVTSFAWLALQIELAERKFVDDENGTSYYA